MTAALVLLPDRQHTAAAPGAYSLWPLIDSTDPLRTAAAHAQRLQRRNRAEATIDKYARCWGAFVRWLNSDERLQSYDDIPASPTVIGLYIGHLNGPLRKLTPGSVLVHLAAITYAHKLLGYPKPWINEPRLQDQIEGLARSSDADAAPKGDGIDREMATDLLLKLKPPKSSVEIRDRAIFCLTWLSAQRRSNIAALRRRDVVFERHPDGTRRLRVFIRRSKTDQRAIGKTIRITELPGSHPLCAVRAVSSLLDVMGNGPEEAPLFQSVRLSRSPKLRTFTGQAMDGRSVTRAVQRLAVQAGLPEHRFAAHSLRRGFATSMQNAGILDAVAMEHGGWKSKQTYHSYNRTDQSQHNAVRELFAKPSQPRSDPPPQ